MLATNDRVLPESLGASSAASGVVVLGLFGATESEALAYGALAWFARQFPIVVLGALPLWHRVGVVGKTLLGRRVTENE